MTDFNDELSENIRLGIKASMPQATEQRVERVWERLVASTTQDFPEVSTTRRKSWLAYAGMATVLFIAGVFTWQTQISSVPKQDIYTTYTTRSGQRASLTLNDGSRVTLGPLTTLRVSNSSNVSVEITGEALFNVNHSATKPFSVTAHGVTTRVLGTEFVVRAYDPSLIRVAVRSGRVSVQPVALTPDNAAIVAAGEAASVTNNKVPDITAISDLDTEFAWASGDLVLSGVPLGDAFVRLSRWYGLKFRATDPALLKAKINGAFPSSFRQKDMRNLAGAINARVMQSGDIVTFTPVNP